MALLVCATQRRNLTLADSTICDKTPTISCTNTTTIHVAAHLHRPTDESGAIALLKNKLNDRVDILQVSPATSWEALVYALSDKDLDSVFKCIDKNDLPWVNQLWHKITQEHVRSLRSFDPLFMEMSRKHVGVRSVFNDLMVRYKQLKNKTNCRRVRFAEVHRAKDVDVDVVNDAPWTHQVLNWFAGRLEPTEMNRRSLYLHGPAGVGKTRFIERLLEETMSKQTDAVESFFLSGLSEGHEYVWLNEFVRSLLNVTSLKTQR